MDTSRTITRTLRPTPAQRVKAALAVVSPLAWTVLGLAMATTYVGRRYEWVELAVIGITFLAILVLSFAFTLGQADIDVSVEVKPQRVRAGEHSAAMVTVGNASGGRMLPVGMELTVGDGVAEFQVPMLGHGLYHEEVFLLPTHRRAIIPVGPATSVRSDPLGLLRRTQVWTEVQPLFVHPRVVSLRELGTGLLRDLDGRPTEQLSDADLAFHALREYQPGDDRRHIHWRSTARVGRHMVRQFVDTRRSHLAVVVDGSEAAYPDEDHFETAVSVAGSLGVRVLRDEQDLSMVVAGERIPTAVGSALLDGLAAVRLGTTDSGLITEVERLFRYASGLSVALLVTGPHTSIAELRAAAARVPLDVRILMMRVDHGAEPAAQPIGQHLLLTLPSLEQLPRLLRSAAS
ncbi:MAG: hypothetical protein JWM47_2097 [Acidimicrobiales bacterium]|nr:hypothetical protein [Acidimicrobiales bacterium]